MVFQDGDLVRIVKAYHTDENKRRVKDQTYGTITDIFEVVGSCVAFEIKGETSPAAYWITPKGKKHSTVCFFEFELRLANKRSADKQQKQPKTWPKIIAATDSE